MEAYRVSPAQVREIIETDINDSVLKNFIRTAHILIDEVLSGSGHSDKRLELIELYLSAHYVSITEERGTLLKTQIGDASETYAVGRQYSTGLNSNRYGQQALMLDTTGRLSTSTKPVPNARLEII